jgi:3-hydroxyisobutyryl-CoA hydrolase
VSSARIPSLLARLHELSNSTPTTVDQAIEEFFSERLPEEGSAYLTGRVREAIDMVFSKNSIEEIMSLLRAPPAEVDRAWAAETLEQLELRSPTSLQLALLAIRKGRSMNLAEALKMELDIATAYCVTLTSFLDLSLSLT